MSSKVLDQTKLSRPGARAPLNDGRYPGTIVSSKLREGKDRFNGGQRKFLNLGIEVDAGDGGTRKVFYGCNYYDDREWSSKLKIYRLLENLDRLPEPGEALDIKSLVGMEVDVMIQAKSKNGKR